MPYVQGIIISHLEIQDTRLSMIEHLQVLGVPCVRALHKPYPYLDFDWNIINTITQEYRPEYDDYHFRIEYHDHYSPSQ